MSEPDGNVELQIMTKRVGDRSTKIGQIAHLQPRYLTLPSTKYRNNVIKCI